MSTKRIIITGASTGIGKAISQYFLDRGHQLVINSANEERLLNTARELGTNRVQTVVGNIAEREVGQRLVDTAVNTFGGVDVLINNAGVFAPKPFLEVTENDLEHYMAINLKGTYFTSQAAIRQMLAQGTGGAIINNGTVLVDHAIAGFPCSAPLVSKGAIHTLTRHLAAEFGKDNIRVNTIAPGIIRSPLQSKIGVEDADSLAGLHLLNRIGEAEEVAEAAYYLAFSGFVTGETLNLSGGHSIGHAI
ncbi:SDR family oxidoreductase [Roseivirga sp. UBA1976]|uniref:SDR family NAD(P)-dependent oxidoreductase n=1 Tax=Roseivirga sp. UBA1976 TaxID=1947386 RepID=UPI00257A82D1|nr:SDR family oxidoreductase [Roseivirga sp. UBA1976]MEC7755580.1 SDR family oxidoreductase [Bacteroidota bacterium]|tara:strand:- start:921 stop:1664 length:744 start_codon:yes stop_codon:yes gene_type:complete